MVHVSPIDHDCVLKDIVTHLMDRVAKLEHQNLLLLKAHIGPKTERAKVPKKNTLAFADGAVAHFGPDETMTAGTFTSPPARLASPSMCLGFWMA